MRGQMLQQQRIGHRAGAGEPGRTARKSRRDSMTTETEQGTQTVWQLDQAHTLIEFGVKHMMVSTVKGRFTEVAGTISGDPNDPTNAQVEVTIQADSIDTRNEQRDAHLKSADFLDVEQYPTITFRSTTIEATQQNVYTVKGELTIKGVTREIDLEASVNGFGTTPYGQEIVGISVTGILSRQEWGLTWNVALETGGVLVGDTAKLNIEVEAVKQVPAGTTA
jgi:polyisoprenoid-binding protein YceI